MTIIFAYWATRKVFGKQGLIQKWKARKEKAKSDKIEKMKSALRKQGLIIEEVEKGATETDEQKPIKFYGKETLATV